MVVAAAVDIDDDGVRVCVCVGGGMNEGEYHVVRVDDA
jgi:hypothetical protein